MDPEPRKRKPAAPARPRRRATPEESDTPFAGPIDEANRGAVWAYRLCVLGLVPGLGLVLGPVGVVWGGLALARGRKNPAFTAVGPARAAVFLGAALALTNWFGLALMLLGLSRSPGP